MRVTRSEPLRLLMTADAVGGVWTYALDLARGLAPHGVETTLAVLGPGPDGAQAADAAAIAGLRVVETRLPLDWTANTPAEVQAAGDAVAALARETRADIVHLNSPALAAATRFPVPVVAACHSCVASWWEAVRGGFLPADFAWRTELVGSGYRNAQRLVAPSAAFSQATARLYGLEAPPQVVRNGRRAFAFERPHEAGPVQAFTAGRLWDEGKNIATLDRAAGRLSLPVLAAGPLGGPNGAAVAVRHVRPLGALSEVGIAARLAARPVFVSLARYEPFGLAVLEAAQAGCALVLSDIPTFRELWDGAARFVPANDDAAAAEAIYEATSDAGLGRAAVQRAQAYSVEAMAADVLGLYRGLIGETPRLRGAAA